MALVIRRIMVDGLRAYKPRLVNLVNRPSPLHSSAILHAQSKTLVNFADGCIHVRRNPSFDLRVDSLWLRDHCRCSQCYNSTTNQRSSDIIDFKGEKSIVSEASLESTTGIDGDQLKIVWTDGHRSTYGLDWIRDNWCSNDSKKERSIDRIRLWSGDELKRLGGPPTVPYDDIMHDRKDARKRFMANVVTYGVACIDGVPITFEDTKKVCEAVALPEETIFGKFWKFSAENMEHADTAYSTLGLGAHTDATYYEQTVGLQVFHLLQHTDGGGGSTLLVDGFKAADELRRLDPGAYRFLATTPIPCHYLEKGAHLASEETVIDAHPITGRLRQFRFNIYDRAPLNTFDSLEQVRRFYESYIALAEIVRKAENEFWIKLQPGTVIFIDNFRVMHGRSAFTGKRVMCGCYLQRDDFLSKARVLGVL